MAKSAYDAQLAQPVSGSGGQPAAEAAGMDALYDVYVGKNQEYYRAQWARLGEGRRPATWNWAGLLLGTSWLLYRKLYVVAGLYYALILGLSFLMTDAYVPETIHIFLNATIAVFGNYLYHRKATREIQKAQEENPREAQDILRRAGGTNLPVAIVVELVFIAISFLPSYL